MQAGHFQAACLMDAMLVPPQPEATGESPAPGDEELFLGLLSFEGVMSKAGAAAVFFAGDAISFRPAPKPMGVLAEPESRPLACVVGVALSSNKRLPDFAFMSNPLGVAPFLLRRFEHGGEKTYNGASLLCISRW